MPFVDGMKHILKNEGIGGVYQGAFATALKQGSNQGLRFMWFNEYKTYMTNDGETELTPLLRLFGGMSAGCFSTLGNNPFDVVKVSQSFCCWRKGEIKRVIMNESLEVIHVYIIHDHVLVLYISHSHQQFSLCCTYLLSTILYHTTTYSYSMVTPTSLHTSILDTYARSKCITICKYYGLFQTNVGKGRYWFFLLWCHSTFESCCTRTRYYLHVF